MPAPTICLKVASPITGASYGPVFHSPGSLWPMTRSLNFSSPSDISGEGFVDSGFIHSATIFLFFLSDLSFCILLATQLLQPATRDSSKLLLVPLKMELHTSREPMPLHQLHGSQSIFIQNLKVLRRKVALEIHRSKILLYAYPAELINADPTSQ